VYSSLGLHLHCEYISNLGEISGSSFVEYEYVFCDVVPCSLVDTNISELLAMTKCQSVSNTVHYATSQKTDVFILNFLQEFIFRVVYKYSVMDQYFHD
jgi:hypothetical protein